MKKVADGNAVPTTTEDVQHDNSYLTEVEIKGQKHPFQLDFDTGSSDLWVSVSALMIFLQPGSFAPISYALHQFRIYLKVHFKARLQFS